MKVIRAFDPDQHRGRDGKWITFSTTMDMDKYNQYYEVHDESTTSSGLTVVTQTNGDMQIAWDDPENPDARHVLLDIEVDDIEKVRDTLDEILDADEQGDWELTDEGADGTDEVWASFSLSDGNVDVYIPLGGDDDAFEMKIDVDEAQELRDALNEQIDRYNELEDDEPPGGDMGRARSPENGETAPAGGQFAVGGGRVGGNGKRTKPRRRAPKKPAAAAGPMSFDGKSGTGYGIKGGDARVRTLQAALTRLGVADSDGKGLAPDGKYGPKTTSAVKKLQAALGLKADGQVTPELLKQVTELKQLPPAAKPARRRRKPPATRSLLLAHINRALRLGVEVRTQQLFDRTYVLDDIQIQRSGDGRTVEAYAAMFGTPYEVRDAHGHYMEIIDRAAFNRTLSNGAGRNALCLYNHGMSVVDGKPDPMAQIPIGTPLEIKPDARGLLTVTRYNKGDYADRLLEAIRNGAIRSQSFRGRIVRSSPDRVPLRSRSGGLPTITRHELGLTDYGPTPIPVNAGAEIMAVRSLTELVQDFAALDDDGRLELLRTLGVDLDGDEAEEPQDEATTEVDDTTTSAQSEPGSEDSPAERSSAGHSGRLELQRAALRAELILKGVRRAEAA